MDIGFLREGFDVRVAVELDPAACATLRTNFPQLRDRIIQKPLEEIATEEILDVAQLQVGEAGCVFGGPPCQSWSIAGNRLGMHDPRGEGLAEFLRVVREAKPLTFCIENVPGLLNHSHFKRLQLLQSELSNAGTSEYEITAAVINSAEFGVPQVRKRAFIVGWRGPGEFCFPAATHQLTSTPNRAWRKPAVTVGQALRGLPQAEAPSPIALSVAKSIPLRNKRWYGRR
jgi:DNA (cytosine-5)-methyltransferase 1